MIKFASYNNFEKTLYELRKEFSKDSESLIKANKEYNLYETEDYAYLEIKMPGFKKDEIISVLSDKILTIKTQKEMHETRNHIVQEFSIENLEYKIPLRSDIASGIFDAKLEDGILTYTIQKAKPKDNSHYIKIN